MNWVIDRVGIRNKLLFTDNFLIFPNTFFNNESKLSLLKFSIIY